MASLLDLVKHLRRNLGCLSLVRDKGLVNAKVLFSCDEQASPFLPNLRHRICCFYPDEELSLMIQDGVDIKEYVVDEFARDNAPVFQRPL